MDVLFVEDQPIVWEATARILTRSPQVGQLVVFNTAEKALTALRAEPDRWGLILLDLDVPGAVGLSLAMEIQAMGLASITCILTGSSRHDYMQQILALGFQGYILKGSEIAELEANLNKVIGGQRAFSTHEAAASNTDAARLTRRQGQVVLLISQGMTDKEIGRVLKLATVTVNHFVRAASVALNARSRSQLVSRAVELGLLTGISIEDDGNV
jgi:DNA-binding NarL/FixJ family response regulator